MEQEILQQTELICRRCKKSLGVNVDSTYFEAGNIRIWTAVRFSCAGCGKPNRFKPHNDDIDGRKGFDGITREILIGLGKEGGK